MKYFDEKRKVKVTIMNKEKEVTQEKLEDIYNSLFNKLNEKIPFPEEFSRNIQAYAKTMANKVFEETKTREDIAKGKEILDSIVDKRKLAKIVFQEAEDKEKNQNQPKNIKNLEKLYHLWYLLNRDL